MNSFLFLNTLFNVLSLSSIKLFYFIFGNTALEMNVWNNIFDFRASIKNREINFTQRNINNLFANSTNILSARSEIYLKWLSEEQPKLAVKRHFWKVMTIYSSIGSGMLSNLQIYTGNQPQYLILLLIYWH